MKLNFFRKLLLMFLTLIILSAGIVGLVRLNSIENNLKDKVQNDIRETAQLFAVKSEIGRAHV